MARLPFTASVLLLLVDFTHGDGTSDLPHLFTNPLFHGTHGALCLGITGSKPMRSWDDFPQWRRFFDAWMMRVKLPFVPTKVDDDDAYKHSYDSAELDANGIRWTKDRREKFNITLQDETLERLGIALRMNVSYSHVDVALNEDAHIHSSTRLQRYYSVLQSDDVDAYVVFVEDSKDVTETHASFLRHDRGLISDHFLEAKWKIRKGHLDRQCEYDVLNKAHTAITQDGDRLKSVNWSEGELGILAKYELRTLRPVIYVVGVSRDEYLRQNASFVTATEQWVHEHSGENRSPVILTSVDVEEGLAQRNISTGKNVVSVFDGVLRSALHYMRLTYFYALQEGEIQAWYISAKTRATAAAGVVDHKRCYLHYDFCITRHNHFNETAQSYLAHVDVGRADVLAKHNSSALGEKEFTKKSRDYRIEDDDVVRFVFGKERIEEPEQECVGFEDRRPHLLHPVGSEVRICLVGRTNAGKTSLFNAFTGANATISPRIFTTRKVMTGSRSMPDDRFEWLAQQFPEATLRPSTITFVDTPALMSPFGSVPWKNDVLEALRACDVLFHVIRAFNDCSVEQYTEQIDDHDEYEDTLPSKHKKSIRDLSDIMRAHDWELLIKLRKDDSFRSDRDALSTIEENLRGHLKYFDGDKWSPIILTDGRVRYHDWSESELAVLERILLLTSKPIVYVLNLDDDAFENASSGRADKTFLDAQAYIKGEDRDALVVPFSGRVPEEKKRTPLFNAAELNGATSIVEKTFDDCQIGHFYTANEELVAAWPFKLGTTTEKAIRLINATLASDVTVVKAVSMGDVVEAGSIEKALGAGVIHLGFDDEIEDGDLLLLTPGWPPEVAGGTAESVTSSPTPGSPSPHTPIEQEGT